MMGERSTIGKRAGRNRNGSAHQRAKRRKNRMRWATRGIKVGSLNIAGASYFKLYRLLDVHEFDVLCL